MSANPYARPRDATKPSAMLVGEFYGQPATDKARNHAAGARNATPAARYQGGVSVVPEHDGSLIQKTTSPSRDTCKGKNGQCKGRLINADWCMVHDPEVAARREAAKQAAIHPVNEPDPAVTIEDLFGDNAD